MDTRTLVKRISHREEIPEELEDEVASMTVDQLFYKINYKEFNSKEEEMETMEYLEENHIPTNLEALDGKSVIRPSLTAIADEHYVDFEDSLNEKEGNPDSLELFIAYRGASYYAIDYEIEECHKIIISNETSEEKRIEAIAELERHLQYMCQYYWTVGFIRATRLMLSIADFYVGDEDKANHFYELAAKYFFKGKELTKVENSKVISITLFGNDDYGWKKMDSAEAEVLEHIPEDRRTPLLHEAEKELDKIVGSNHVNFIQEFRLDLARRVFGRYLAATYPLINK